MSTSVSSEFENNPTTYTDRLTLLEDRGDYLQALAYARDLHQRAPANQTDVRRLAHLYVLSGSREPYLSALQNRFQAAQRGEGSLALIRGVAGIGKSSFARALSDWARRQGAITAVGRCYEHGVALTMTPWQEILRSLALITTTNHDHLPAPFGHQPPAPSVDATIALIGAYLETLIADKVAVVLLDDLHWADPDTLDLLEYVTRQIEHLPLLLLATYRSDEVDAEHPLYTYLPALQRDRPADSIRLSEFDLDDTSRFVEVHLGSYTPALVRYLHQRSDGHPLFLAELLDDLVEQKLLHQDAHGRWSPPDKDVPIPTLLRQIILQRVARLGQRCESILDVAAVIGDVWTLHVVEALLGWPEEQLLDELEKILSARIIEVDDSRGERYRFGHGLIREALYRRQIPRRRRQMHGRIADRLEEMLRAVSEPGQEDEIEAIGELAFHAFCAERWSDAFRYGREAAKSAEQRHAPHAILHYGQQTLFAATQQPDVATADDLLELHEQLGYAALLLGRKEDALDSFRQMLEAANGMDDQARVANALFRLAEVQERNYEHDQSAETRRVALALVTEQTAPQLLARFHFSLAHHGVAIGGLGEARNHLAEAERHAHAANDEQILIDSERLQVYLTIFQGAYAHGKRLTEMGLARARAAGDAPRVALACWQLGFILIERGEYGRANQTLLDGLEQDESIGEHHYYLIRIRNLLGYLHREVGDLASAMRWNQAALDTNRQDGSHHATECACYSLIDMAANHLAAGQIEASETWLRDFKIMAASATYGRYRYGNRAQLFQAELALARHEYDLALVHAKQAMEVAAADVMKKNIVRSLLFQGRALSGLGRLEEAVIQLQQSVALADDIGHASLRWQTRLALADVSQRSGRNSNNLRHEADELIRNIAGKLHDSHLRDAFLNSKAVAVAMEALTAADTDENRPVEARPAGLTRREIEVLSLVAAGLTDRQIAEQLHIALRTVNTHVTNILNKTGCDNRTAAAAFAVRRGLTDADS